MTLAFGTRRAIHVNVAEQTAVVPSWPTLGEIEHFELLDRIYRSLCALLFNYVPSSGHPGGSISSGRFAEALLFDTLEYDLSDPDREDADVISYAAGHKAMGLYSLWALRDEMVRMSEPSMLPDDRRYRLRLEDLLGFRRNPTTHTPLFKAHQTKALDGHPTPATPFVRLSTGASGVGVASSIGLALGARDWYGKNAPRVHIVEGEGGLTPGRVAEALAAAATAGLDNVFLHLDWNQASIDSNRVCREGEKPGDYVQWSPMELFYLHDWNVVYAPDGRDFRQILAAQRFAGQIDNGQPTAVIYRTIKGWKYGIEGRGSHGAGHKLCSDGFYQALAELTGPQNVQLPSCEAGKQRCMLETGGNAILEECFYDALGIVRQTLAQHPLTTSHFARQLGRARSRLEARGRKPRENGPHLDAAYETARAQAGIVPPELQLKPGTVTTLRGELGRVISHYNKISGGAIFAAAADLLGSTSLNTIGAGFGEGFWHSVNNPTTRLLSTGGICEDAMSGILSGLATFGHHLGAGSSYGAFLAPLGHIAARLHCIGQQSRRAIKDEPFRPMILVCAHVGLKTGEDGPTHADPQPLQLLQENFPRGTLITLTPWDPQENWPLFSTALARRPAVIAPFVTRPNERVPDREKLGLAPAVASVSGVYLLRRPRGNADVTIVLQESAAAYAFIEGALPLLERDGVDPRVYYVSSAELFDLLPESEQQQVFPEAHAMEAVGITGFTVATMYRWIRSDIGRAHTLHPFFRGHFLGSGQGTVVLDEAGLDGSSQHKAVRCYLDALARRKP